MDLIDKVSAFDEFDKYTLKPNVKELLNFVDIDNYKFPL